MQRKYLGEEDTEVTRAIRVKINLRMKKKQHKGHRKTLSGSQPEKKNCHNAYSDSASTMACASKAVGNGDALARSLVYALAYPK